LLKKQQGLHVHRNTALVDPSFDEVACDAVVQHVPSERLQHRGTAPAVPRACGFRVAYVAGRERFCTAYDARLRRIEEGKLLFRPLLLLGQRITARQAHDLGLVNRVVAAEDFDDAVGQWASELAAKSPLLMQMGKRAIAFQRDLPLHEALEYLRGQLSLAQSTDDIREGVTAFFEKRDPVWRGQ
jgi:enoyl-CoA hydratase/carnithine racemase